MKAPPTELTPCPLPAPASCVGKWPRSSASLGAVGDADQGAGRVEQAGPSMKWRR